MFSWATETAQWSYQQTLGWTSAGSTPLLHTQEETTTEPTAAQLREFNEELIKQFDEKSVDYCVLYLFYKLYLTRSPAEQNGVIIDEDKIFQKNRWYYCYLLFFMLIAQGIVLLSNIIDNNLNRHQLISPVYLQCSGALRMLECIWLLVVPVAQGNGCFYKKHIVLYPWLTVLAASLAAIPDEFFGSLAFWFGVWQVSLLESVIKLAWLYVEGAPIETSANYTVARITEEAGEESEPDFLQTPVHSVITKFSVTTSELGELQEKAIARFKVFLSRFGNKENFDQNIQQFLREYALQIDCLDVIVDVASEKSGINKKQKASLLTAIERKLERRVENIKLKSALNQALVLMPTKVDREIASSWCCFFERQACHSNLIDDVASVARGAPLHDLLRFKIDIQSVQLDITSYQQIRDQLLINSALEPLAENAASEQLSLV